MLLLTAPQFIVEEIDPWDLLTDAEIVGDFYRVTGAGAAKDNSDASYALGGLKGFHLPVPHGNSYFRGEWNYDQYAVELQRYNNSWSEPPEGEEGGGGTEPTPGTGTSQPIMYDLPDTLQIGKSDTWCGRASRGDFYFRGGVVQDFRWDVKTVPEVVACEATSLTFADCGPEYAGIELRTDLLPGPGIPTVEHYTSSRGLAEREADNLYKELEQNVRNTMSASIYHLEISEARLQRYDIPEEQVPHADECSSWWDFLPFVSSDQCADFRYRRYISGRVRRYTFRDPRVGTRGSTSTPADSSGGVWFEYDVNLSGGSIYFRKWEEMTMIEDAVQSVCGTTDGCTLSGPHDGGVAEGIVTFAGSDDSLRMVQTCRAIAEDNATLGGPEACDDMRDNPFMPGMDPTNSELAAMGSEPGDWGGPAPTPITEEERTQHRTGVRTIDGDTVESMSQHGRLCAKIMAQDSIQQVNGPVPVGTDRSEITYEPSERVPEDCLVYREEADGGGG